MQYKHYGTYELLGEEFSKQTTKNLISYFLFKEPLADTFSDKEKQHYKDVRMLYLIVTFLGIASFFGFTYYCKREYISNTIKTNVVIIGILNVLMFFNFKYFWEEIFHKILFRNDFYILEMNEISYYLFSQQFFENTIIFIIMIFLIENLLLFLISKLPKRLYKSSN